MPKLIALKSFTYATRHLVAEDAFEASNRDARVLVAVKRAKLVVDAPSVNAAPALSSPPAPALEPAIASESKPQISASELAQSATEDGKSASTPAETASPEVPRGTDIQPLSTTTTPALMPGTPASAPMQDDQADSEGGATDVAALPDTEGEAGEDTAKPVAAKKTGRRSAASTGAA